jgi:asparagine synthetase B (glutamine-hydrolysing)
MAIGGFLLSTNTEVPSATGLIRQMARTLRHAHDQSIQTWVSPGQNAGLCEVASSPLAAQRPQIITHRSGTRAVVLAGQIDNDPAERCRLVKGSEGNINPLSDGEFVLQLYSSKGVNGFKDLRGSFAP